jgi:choline-sulfatase
MKGSAMRIVYIDIDCLRTDHLSCNGYPRNTTPNIDRIAAEGVSFTNCHTSNSPCLPSRAALFTGRFGFNNGIVSHHGVGERLRPNHISHAQDPDKPFFVHQLWSHGLRTVAFSTFHDRHNAWWWSAGWEELHVPSHKKGGETADEIGAPALRWFEENASTDNWFIDVHFWDVHSKYRVPREWRERFRDEPLGDFPNEETVARQKDFYGPRTANDLYTSYPDDERPDDLHPDGVHTLEDAKMLVDGADGSLAYVDWYIGRIVDELEKQGVLDDTAIIVSADHGDSFGEHGQYMDHGIANVAVHNIPMVIKWPGMTGRGLDDSLVYNLDLCPTVCDLLDISTPSEWDGESFIGALRGDDFAGRDYLVYDHGIYTFSRAVRTRDWTLISMLHPGLYPYDSQFYLHDLVNDPWQQENLYPERRDVFNELSGYMAEWRMEQVRKCGAPDPLEAMVAEGPFTYYSRDEMEDRFGRTGREHLIEEFRHRLSGIRDDAMRKYDQTTR